MILLIQYTIVFTSVLLLVALGGCFSEHSGVINIGLEGIMVFGALGGALVMSSLPTGTPGFLIVVLAILAAMILGMIYSLLLAVAAIHFKADQTLVGTAMNLLGTAAATVIVKAINTSANPNNPSSTLQYINTKKAFLLAEGYEFNWFMPLALCLLILSYVILYKTRFGLRLMSCGEHPQAAASVGIDVYKMRYSGVLISGLLGGLGGLVYITAGVSVDEFGPERTVTRAQAMTFLYGAAGRPEAGKEPFEDVNESDYFAAPVAWAFEKGITSGKTQTQFGPNDPCTRAQIVTFLHLLFAE